MEGNAKTPTARTVRLQKRTTRFTMSDKENFTVDGSLGGRKSPLPENYPRKPLQDITAVLGSLDYNMFPRLQGRGRKKQPLKVLVDDNVKNITRTVDGVRLTEDSMPLTVDLSNSAGVTEQTVDELKVVATAEKPPSQGAGKGVGGCSRSDGRMDGAIRTILTGSAEKPASQGAVTEVGGCSGSGDRVDGEETIETRTILEGAGEKRPMQAAANRSILGVVSVPVASDEVQQQQHRHVQGLASEPVALKGTGQPDSEGREEDGNASISFAFGAAQCRSEIGQETTTPNEPEGSGHLRNGDVGSRYSQHAKRRKPLSGRSIVSSFR